MKIIKTSEDALTVLKKTRLQAPEALKTKGYNYLPYECGCGKSHDVNDPKVIQFAAAQIIRLILLCPNKFYTMIKIKGFFKQKCISEWACSKKAFESAIDKRFPEWKDGVRAVNSVTLFYKNQNK